MTTNDAALGMMEKAKAAFPTPSTAGSAPAGTVGQVIRTKTLNADGAITGDNEDLGVMHAPDPVGHFMLVALPKVELSKLLIEAAELTIERRNHAAFDF